MRGSPWPVVAAVVVIVTVLLLGLAELVLPGVAEDRVRSTLGDRGEVRSVQVETFPAVKLLGGKADEVDVRMGDATAEGSRGLADLLEDAGQAKELDASAETLRVGRFLVRDGELSKDGDELEATGTLTRQDLEDALPSILSVQDIQAKGDALVVTASVAGLAQVPVNLTAEDGRLMLAADAGLLSAFTSIVVFEDPRVAVETITVQPEGSGDFRFTTTGRLVG